MLSLLSYCGSVDAEKKALDELFSIIYRDRAITQRRNYRVKRCDKLRSLRTLS